MALKLLDAVVRHQIYLEGLKAGQLASFGATTRLIERDVKTRLLGMSYSTMDGMTKAQLRRLLVDLREVLNRHYSSYVESLILFLRKFMAVDTDMSQAIFASFLTDEQEPPEPASEDRRWGIIAAAPMPANGALLLAWIRSLSNVGTGSILLRVNQGYANAEPVKDTVAAIVGTSDANFKDGVTARTTNNARAVIGTALQHVSATNNAEIAKIIWPRYRWVSVLDDRTTNICRRRSGLIYVYGKGPLPPAHPGCRSTTMPLVAGQDEGDFPGFADWAKAQPPEVLRDMFGTSRPASSFANPIPLTLDRYAAKKSFVTNDG